jgi:hypothetical protein
MSERLFWSGSSKTESKKVSKVSKNGRVKGWEEYEYIDDATIAGL